MKKTIITTMLISITLLSQAQIFVGGLLGVSTEKESGYSYFGWGIDPMVGYQLNDKLALGTTLEVGTTERSSTIKAFSLHLGINIFAQYTFLTFNKFSMYAEGGIRFVYRPSHHRALEEYHHKTQQNNFGIKITPCIAYNVNKHISLVTSLNFLGLGFSYATTKGFSNKNDATDTNFDFGINSNNIINLGGVTLGFIYKL